MKPTRVLATTIASSIAVFGLAQQFRTASPQQTTSPEGTPEYVLDGSKGYRLEILGVASFDDDTITCWDIQGKRSEPLNALAKKHFSGTFGSIQWNLRQKNRYLITRATGQTFFRFNRQKPGVVKVAGYSSGESQIVFERLDSIKNEKLLNLDIRLETSEYIPFPLDFKSGAQSSSEGLTVKLEDLKCGEFPKSTDSGYLRILGTCWTIAFKLNLNPDLDMTSPYLQFQDKNKANIAYVDRQGQPVTHDLFMTDPEPESMFIRTESDEKATRKTKYLRALYYQRQRTWQPSSYDMSINVDPSAIKYIQILVQKEVRYNLKALPLEPVD